ncbi:MAG: hypothetical protein OHK0023_04320 [Anaerolineae bacterium]
MSDLDDLRNQLVEDEFETEFGITGPATQRVENKRLFGFTAGERMVLSLILFMAVSVVSVALLFLTNTIAIP